MFTGLVQAVGSIVRIDPLEIDAGSLDLSNVALGDSICVQGVCLTATALRPRGFSADVSAETLRVTAGLERPGKVNLEKSLRVGDPLGGHLVTGHVDGVGELTRRSGSVFAFRAPQDLARFIASKGSICVDGVSLTVNAVAGEVFEVNLIPHTLEVTTLGRLQPGAKVNLEIDLIARYVERLLGASQFVRAAGPDPLNPSALLSQAFLALGLLLGGSAALAQPVKCVDASGKVRYLDASAMGQEKCTPVKAAVNVITPQGGKAPAAGSKAAGARNPEARVEKAERALAQAKEKLAEQEATRSGGERNYARVEARLKPFQDAVEKAQKDVDQARRDAR